MRGIGERRIGHGVVLGDQPVRAGEGVEVVDLDGVEAVGGAPGDPLPDDAGELRAALAVVGASMISFQSGSMTGLPFLSRSIRSGWFAFHLPRHGLDLESVDVADVVEPGRGRVGPVARDDLTPAGGGYPPPS